MDVVIPTQKDRYGGSIASGNPLQPSMEWMKVSLSLRTGGLKTWESRFFANRKSQLPEINYEGFAVTKLSSLNNSLMS